jgi:hypothetical protein
LIRASSASDRRDRTVPLVTVTINNPAIALEKRFQEVDFIARGLALASQAIQSAGGQQTSGNIATDGAVVIGSWVYAPQASS